MRETTQKSGKGGKKEIEKQESKVIAASASCYNIHIIIQPLGSFLFSLLLLLPFWVSLGSFPFLAHVSLGIIILRIIPL